MDERVQQLTSTILTDLRRVSAALGQRTKREAGGVAVEAAPGGGLALAGLVVAAVGGAILLVAPAIPRNHLRLRRRMLGTSFLYLLGGGTAAAFGALAVREVLSGRARDVKQDVHNTTEVVKEHIHHGPGTTSGFH